MSRKHFSGIEAEEEISAKSLIRDTRTQGQKFNDFITNPFTLAISIFGGGMLSFMFRFPLLPEVAILAGAYFTWFGLSRKAALSFRAPMSSFMKDWNDIHPGTGKPVLSRGISYFGNRLYDDTEVWFNDDDLRTHILIFGSTGSGKTEALLSLAYNALNQGSGLIYVDGKGDNSLWAKVYGMVRARGREDDLLVINYMTGNMDISAGPKANRLSNTTNPLATSSSDGLTQLIVGLMDGGGEGKGGDMWKGRAISMISGLMMALVSLRDRGELLLDVQALREYMNIDKIIALAKDESLPETARNSLTGYCESLPGFVWKKGANQGETTLEQHGYLQMQFTKILGSLSDNYGHIFKTQMGEVDFYDVVVNRRILVVLLPALEKAPDELTNLGKIIVASLKSMMATGLGAEIEGYYKDVVLSKPNNSPAPFLTILDEYGYYAVPGSAVMPAQARSLGFSMVFAGQDLPAFEKASPEEASSILGNCNIKIFMKLEEPEKTYKLFEATAGQSYVTHTGGFQSSVSMLGNNYMDVQNASIEKRDRGNLTDLQKQKPGEAHILFGGSVVRVKFFYASPQIPEKLRVNRFLKVKKPSRDMVMSFHEHSRNLMAKLTNPDFVDMLQQPPYSEDIATAVRAMEDHAGSVNTHEIGIAALVEYRRALDERADDFTTALTMHDGADGDDEDGEEGFDFGSTLPRTDADGNMLPRPGKDVGHIFSDNSGSSDNVFLQDLLGESARSLSEMVQREEDAAMAQGGADPFLDRAATHRGIRDIEMQAGADAEEANETANQTLETLEEATAYPNVDVNPGDVEVFMDAIKGIDDYISMVDSGTGGKDE